MSHGDVSHMALITCKDCKQQFSTDAKQCPHCGAKPPYRWTIGKIIIGGFVVLFGVSMLMSAGDPEQRQERTRVADEIDAQLACERAVKKQLKTPSVAEFVDTRAIPKKEGDGFLVGGQVDSQNSFGAKLRTKWVCTALRNGADLTVSATLIE